MRVVRTIARAQKAPNIMRSVLTTSMLALGFLHGLGGDHLMAIAALSLATPLGPARYGRAFWLAVRFAVGHAALLGAGTALVLVFGWQIPVRFEQMGELAGGCTLIVLGVAGAWMALTGRVYAHAHAHAHGSGDLHSHWHLHIGARHSHQPAVHTAVPGLLGAVFAVSGLRAMMMSLPLWSAPHAAGRAVLLVALFALGILTSMSLFGIVLAHVLDTRRLQGQVARCAAAATSVASLVLGLYWIS